MGRLLSTALRTPRDAAAAHGGRRWRWPVVLVVCLCLVLLGPTSFPRLVDAACPAPDVMRAEDGECIVRGELLVITGEHSGGLTRSDLERAIVPLGGRIETALDAAAIYAVAFAAADTLAELDGLEAALEGSGFWVSRNWVLDLFGAS